MLYSKRLAFISGDIFEVNSLQQGLQRCSPSNLSCVLSMARGLLAIYTVLLRNMKELTVRETVTISPTELIPADDELSTF